MTHLRGSRRKNAGFSLIELMVVIVILGILATLLVPKIMDRPDEARITKARLDIQSIETALKLYRLDKGRYPTTEQGLGALAGDYLENTGLPKDPWGNEYIYQSPGPNGSDYDIVSLGADGKEGGTGKDSDLSVLDEKG
ncbi:general secretion pathway protein G [Desulfobaculum xiamenense]|uniref:Type II secretion system core protein G n=1 Tax=Desulfobaculum xiamenense TaxID=995050 RepID=A0A846QQL8_9BACT|nr:type II secretion system major pseudopilin GspG [Desulfobaculum xiamenense]NJB68653.1 general secretion pathway protein G [Desulfobaculum xiamenense]